MEPTDHASGEHPQVFNEAVKGEFGSMGYYNYEFPDLPPLEPNEVQVFKQLLPRRSMPTFEISGLTGLYGPLLTTTLDELRKKKLITISPSGSATTNIVTVHRKYF